MLKPIWRQGLAVAAFWLGAAVAPAETVAPAPASAVLPADVKPLPPELGNKVQRLLKEAEKWRQLAARREVPCGSVDEAALKKKILLAFKEELPPEKMATLETCLKAFEFIPARMNFSDYYAKLLTSQVGGMYDPRRKYLVIVQREGGVLGAEAKEKLGADLSARMEETVLVHEFTHSLQDQYFDLEKFEINDPLSDEGAARTALVEGDATLTMYDYFMGMQLEKMPGVEQVTNGLLDNFKDMMAVMPDLPGSKDLADAPAWVRDNMLFSYLQGLTFCIHVKNRGGVKLLDYAFRTDPPRSTAQILHPEKWCGPRRQDPMRIHFPDLIAAIPAALRVYEGQLGELNTRILLRAGKHNGKELKAEAAGWAGDRFAVFQKAKDAAPSVAWITEWDTANDRDNFKAAAEMLGADWSVEAVGQTRVVLVRGELLPHELAAVKAQLAAAVAEPGANKPIDLKAFAPDADAASAQALDQALKTVLQGGGGDGQLDLTKLMKDPSVVKLAAKLLGENSGEKKTGVAALLNDPQVQNAMGAMLKQEMPKGVLSADERTYTNEKAGFRISAPASRPAWKLQGDPPLPLTLVVLKAPDTPLQISVSLPPLPMSGGIEQLGPAMEMGMQIMLQNYHKISDKLMEVSGVKGYELRFEGKAQGVQVRGVMRALAAAGGTLILTAMGDAETWKTDEQAINQVLDSLVFFPAKPPK